MPHLTRSSLHRCFQRHGIARLPEIEGDKPAKKKFKAYPIGYFHIDIAEVRTEEGKLYLFVAIDRTSKFAYAELHEKARTQTACDFLKALLKAVPYKVHSILTTTASSSPICRRTAQSPQPYGAGIPSTGPVRTTTSSIASPSRTILGPTARSNA